jgi:hypothetical protein
MLKLHFVNTSSLTKNNISHNFIDDGEATRNDLWRYDGSLWAWMGGTSTLNNVGNWGSLGVPSTTNAPSARAASAAWTDNTGMMWLWGGIGKSAAGPPPCNLSLSSSQFSIFNEDNNESTAYLNDLCGPGLQEVQSKFQGATEYLE